MVITKNIQVRIVGKYPSEAAVYKGTEENKLNGQHQKYKRKYINIREDLLTNKPVENTKSGKRIDSKNKLMRYSRKG